MPAIYTSQVPTELIVFKGQPDFVPIVGTQLLWASNTTSDVLINTANNNYYVLLAGRWFTSARPQRAVDVRRQQRAAARLRAHPAAFARRRRAADRRRHAAGAGSGDRELDSADGDRAAQERAEVHAELRRPAAVRADRRHAAHLRDELAGPVIQVAPNAYYAVDRRRLVHRAAADRPVDHRDLGAAGDLHDPAVVADPLRDLRADLRGDAAGTSTSATRRAISARWSRPTAPSSTAPATRTSPWIGTVWYAPPYTYGVAAAPIYNPYVGYTYGFAMGLATAAWMEP